MITEALLARNPFPAPNIPSAAYNPVTPADFTAFDTGCPTGNNLAVSTRFSNRVDSFIGKVDHNFNPSNMLTGRYYFGDSDQSFPLALTGETYPNVPRISNLSQAQQIDPAHDFKFTWDPYTGGGAAEYRRRRRILAARARIRRSCAFSAILACRQRPARAWAQARESAIA